MKKIALLSVVGVLCVALSVSGQAIQLSPFYLGDVVPALPLKKITNYSKQKATLSDFKGKVLILSFWAIHCRPCIKNMPLEDSLQKKYGNNIQFLMITSDKEAKVMEFLKSRQESGTAIRNLPIIFEDNVLWRLFRHKYMPHYVWLAPDGTLLAATGEVSISGSFIETVLGFVKKKSETEPSAPMPAPPQWLRFLMEETQNQKLSYED